MDQVSVILVHPNGGKNDDFGTRFWGKGLLLCDKSVITLVELYILLYGYAYSGCGVP
jgi:hypothetical protein